MIKIPLVLGLLCTYPPTYTQPRQTLSNVFREILTQRIYPFQGVKSFKDAYATGPEQYICGPS